MRNTTKLLPALLLGSALGGCSMAGTGDYFADQYGQEQQSQYWGAASSDCQQQQPQQQRQSTACGQAYAPAQQTVPSYSAPAPQPYGQAVPQQQVYTGQNVYQGAQGYTGQELYQGQQTYAGYQGQQGYQQNGYAPAGYAPAYVNPQGRSSRGLRQSYTYGTLGAVLYDVDSDFYGIQGRLGWQSKSYFGAEVEGSFGVSDDDGFVDFGTGFVESEVEIDTQIAAFAVARYPVSQKFNVLGRVGYHNTELEAEFDDGITQLEQDFSTDGLAYGAGVEYALDHRTSVRADFTIYDFDGPDADSVSLAISRKF